ncbi:MAG: Na/Pi cotransporter family protein [Firmicutes bacterium]|nr:Na/Pi cotransporter family protein [Bacillota bacterium]
MTKTNQHKMRLMLKKFSSNRWSGFGLGIGVTAAVQSSSATTVMVVGLVNAGILTLFQATAIIMGANIGSTITSIMASLSAFPVKYFFMAVGFIGVFIKLFTKKESAVRIADILVAFGVLFVGMELMNSAFKGDPTLRNGFQALFEKTSFPLLGILLGIAFTMITQSSAGTMALVISMISMDVLAFDVAIYIVLGANVGTTLTAFLAAAVANTNAKRAAVIHFAFNFLGTVLFTIIIWPLQRWFVPFYQGLISDPVWQISSFHIMFNILTAFALIGFIKPLNRLVELIIKEKPQDDDILRLTYASDDLLSSPISALGAALKEIKDLAEKSQKNVDRAFNILLTQNFHDKEKIHEEKAKIDYLHQLIAQYLVKLSRNELPEFGESLLGKMYHFTSDVKRFSGHSIFMLINAQKLKENGLKFTPEIIAELKAVYAEVTKLLGEFYSLFDEKEWLVTKLRALVRFSKEIRKTCDAFHDSYLEKLSSGVLSVELGEHVYQTYISFRSIAGFISYIAATLVPRGEDKSDAELNQIMQDRRSEMEPALQVAATVEETPLPATE